MGRIASLVLAGSLVAAGPGLLGVPTAAHASGASAFDQECGDCHSVTPGKNKKGPSLAGVIGRKPGTAAGFANYSDAMKANGTPWSAARIDAYIRNPKAVVPGGTMKYEGSADDALRASIVSYLVSGR
ncbi:c-type cytochrome [Prosthecodimorpha staleyi]|uniref:C-type cytochrome n=1 Tax=Prosthecodimorpha staleyi TaxID=2840188 RepID=A0A947D0T1_9HYPH|nr:c-type cytochrome [Prosthecodimorpha staleyi]MBT9288838.1 c-type cytochrome [Prosthecodimorpha staleyi]